MEKAIPVLRVFDHTKTIEFYVDWLGFTVEWEHKPVDTPFYMQVSIRGVAINLSQHHGECSPGGLVLVSGFKNLKDYHQLLINKQYPFMRPGLEKVPWDADTISMTVIDPFYNRIEFCEQSR